MKKKKLFLLFILIVLNIKFAFSQLKNVFYIYDNGNETKIEEVIDTTNYKNWKITRLTYFPETEQIKKKETELIRPKQKELFYIYKKETEYFETGNKSHEFVLKNNLKDSIETYWYENGQKSSLTRWYKGKKQGRYISWYQNGDLFLTDNYKNDTIIGEIFFFASKKMREKHNQFFSIDKYENGNIISSESFGFDGSLEETTVYNDTARITKSFYKSGSIKRMVIEKETEYLFEPKNRIEEYYREEGNLKMTVVIKNGKTTIKEYDKNGKYINPYKNGKRRKILKE